MAEWKRASRVLAPSTARTALSKFPAILRARCRKPSQTLLTMAAMGEALVLAARAGADVARVVEALRGGGANCWALQVRAPLILQGDLRPGFKAHMHQKDLDIVMEAGKTYQIPLPVASTVHELYRSMIARGRGDLDTSAVFTVIEDLANFSDLSIVSGSKL